MESSSTRPPRSVSLPFKLRHIDPNGPLAIDTTIVAWHAKDGSDVVCCVLGEGILHDADKGQYSVQGLELTLHTQAGGTLEPAAIAIPGVLSEFQQEWLLDAVCSVLNALGATDREAKVT